MVKQKLKIINCDTIQLGNLRDLQPFGCLLILDDDFKIINLSENTSDLLGYNSNDALGESIFTAFKCLPGMSASLKRLLKKPASHKSDMHRFKDYSLSYKKAENVHIIEIERLEANKDVDLSSIMPKLEQRFLNVNDTSKLAKVFVSEFRKLYALNQVMVYQFNDDWSGTVIAESRQRDMTTYLGLRFPAQDVPENVRKNYHDINARYIPDINYEGQKLLGEPSEAVRHLIRSCDINSVMSVHKQYLHNMNIVMSMSIPIFVHNKLWGLVACHHKEPFYISPKNRFFMRFLANFLALHVALTQDHEFAKREKLLLVFDRRVETEINRNEDLNTALKKNTLNLLRFLKAKGYVAYINDEMIKRGNVPSDDEISAIIRWLKKKNIGRLYHTHDLLEAYPGKLSNAFCGLLAVTISKQDNDFVLFFRPGIMQEITWAGDPNYQPTVTQDHGSYHPRNSFERLKQQIDNHAEPFSAYDLRCAEIIRNALNNKLLQEMLATKAYVDPLTKLHNSRFMKEKVIANNAEDFIDRRGKEQGKVVAMLDIDKFKNINDTYGHPFGDKVLAHLGKIIRKKIRSNDIVCRYGGEEFMIVLPNCSAQHANNVLEKLRKSVESSYLLNNKQRVRYTISIGYYYSVSDSEHIETMLKRADSALYKVKKEDRNRVVASK
jgi:diguanylate cyclase (GGDEF)-like protein